MLQRYGFFTGRTRCIFVNFCEKIVNIWKVYKCFIPCAPGVLRSAIRKSDCRFMCQNICSNSILYEIQLQLTMMLIPVRDPNFRGFPC